MYTPVICFAAQTQEQQQQFTSMDFGQYRYHLIIWHMNSRRDVDYRNSIACETSAIQTFCTSLVCSMKLRLQSEIQHYRGTVLCICVAFTLSRLVDRYRGYGATTPCAPRP
jgi:hypothetical protein